MHLRLASAEKTHHRQLLLNKCEPFSAVSSRYLNRGRFWVVRTENNLKTGPCGCPALAKKNAKIMRFTADVTFRDPI
jgi:hypothetical protein